MSRRLPSALVSLVALMLVIAGLVAGALAQVEGGPPALEGRYNCTGANADGVTYKGVTTITKKKDVYLLQWVIGREGYDGIGILSGRVLSVAYKAGDVVGVVAYTVEQTDAGSKLSGKWSMHPGSGVVLAETLTPEK